MGSGQPAPDWPDPIAGGGGGGDVADAVPVADDDEDGADDDDEDGAEDDDEAANEGAPPVANVLQPAVFEATAASPGPTNLTTRVRNVASMTDEQRELRQRLAEQVGTRCKKLHKKLRLHPLRHLEELCDRLEEFFLFLKRFEFVEGQHDANLNAPPNWAIKIAEQRRFGELKLRNGGGAVQRVNRMQDGDFNKPQDYTICTNKSDAVLEVLIRTLNRLVNERVQRVFALPDNDARIAFAQNLQPNCEVSRGTAATKFLHLSQRAFWREEVFKYALWYLKEDYKALNAQVEQFLYAP
jgi:hypothetical protein